MPFLDKTQLSPALMAVPAVLVVVAHSLPAPHCSLTGCEVQTEQVCFPHSFAFFLQGHISFLKNLVSSDYSYLWVRPSVSREQLQTMSGEVDEIGKLVLG